ncbi:hypothetical protein PAMP_021402 [Pampus punctatissimus]
MLLADVCVFVGFFLCISVSIKGVQGQANSICALKGSSVDLPCSAQHPTSGMKWFTVHWNKSEYFQNELRADGKKYNMSEESNNTLTIKDLTEKDAKFYCCGETDTNASYLCWHRRTELHVADLQVKVIPSTEGQTVTLICNTSCLLTEKPAAYIWYKNREFLYQDWSPWYQQLVSSEESVRYSCAVKGYKHLRAPEVSVDSVTSTCFTVSYAKGRMCLNNQSRSMDEPCSITYPREIHVQKTLMKNCVTLSCASSCPTADLHTSYRLYGKMHFKYSSCESQAFTVFNPPPESFSCAIQGNKELHSAEVCIKGEYCGQENYLSRRICALEGSSVNISIKYYDSVLQYIDKSKLWHKIETGGPWDFKSLISETGRVNFYDSVNDHHILTINNLQKNDSAGYKFRVHKYYQQQNEPDFPQVTLVVTGNSYAKILYTKYCSSQQIILFNVFTKQLKSGSHLQQIPTMYYVYVYL